MSPLFNKFFAVLMPFYVPEDGSGGGLPLGEGKESMVDFLNQDDDDDTEIIDLQEGKDKDKEGREDKGKEKAQEKEQTPDTDEDDDEEDDDEDDEDLDELDEIEKELEGPSDEELELVTPVRRKEILKKYPTLFKDFPYLEKAYYREQQFTEIFPYIDDAKKAQEDSNTLHSFEEDLGKGNTEKILSIIKQKSPKSFNKVVDNYLVTLSKVDKDAYLHVVGNTIKHTIAAMANEARRSGNEDLMKAAQQVNQFTFSSSEYTPPTTLTKEGDDKPDEEERISQKEKDFNRRQFETARTDLNSRISNSLKVTIEANIDSKNAMSEYVKKHACREALDKISSLIAKDARFRVLSDKLWEAAMKDGYSKASTDRIKAAYISKAKTLLPAVLKTARNEALKGMGKRVKEEKDSEHEEVTRSKESRNNNREQPSPRNRGQKTSKITNPRDIPSGMKSIDFLMADD